MRLFTLRAVFQSQAKILIMSKDLFGAITSDKVETNYSDKHMKRGGVGAWGVGGRGGGGGGGGPLF